MCVMLTGLVLEHCKTRGTVVNGQRSGERLERVSSFHNFRFFDGISVDVGFGERGSQLNRGRVLSGVIRSGFFFRELDSKVFRVYGGRCFNLQCLCFAVFVEVILDEFVRVTRPLDDSELSSVGGGL